MAEHPLDPLTAGEIRAAAAILRRDCGVGERWRFASIELREPSKATVREFEDTAPIHREAIMVPLMPRSPGVVRRKPNGKYEIVVDRDFDAWIGRLEEQIRAAG